MKYKLNDIERKNNFQVPDGYFEDLSMKIQQRIAATEQKSRKVAIPAWSLAMAASVFLILTFIFILPENNPSAEDLLAEVDQEELVAYLDQMDLDEYDIVSAMSEDASEFDLEDTNMLDGINLEEQSIDDVLQEYDLSDEYL